MEARVEVPAVTQAEVQKLVFKAPAPGGETPRQRTQRELEQEAGRKRVAYHAEIEATRPRPPPKPDPREGIMVPVFRPGDHVPGILAATLKARGFNLE